MVIFADMKVASYLLLFIFLTFITLPTLVKIFDNRADVTAIFNMSEEEESGKSFSKLKEVIKASKVTIAFNPNYQKAVKIVSDNRVKHDAVSRELFSPPPEFLI